MSSADSYTSNTPRIRQFGLYRSIDSRTEEFLRLSRKRQIRQGCACAAASTAITVTVVVVVIFIYEFSFKTDPAGLKLRSNWFNLINETTEDAFEQRFTKGNIDKTTLTLLPILFKALTKNVFLRNILEEQSSSRPNEDGKETTEYSFEKNIFTRALFRMPSSKIYAMEYKTSPVASYRPTTNNEYFSKIRKIREYDRIFNYVDKMINEKVYIGSSKPIIFTEINSEKPFKSSMVVANKQKSKNYYYNSFPQKIQEVKRDRSHLKTKDCNCSTEVGNLLNKIFSALQLLLPVRATKQNIKPDDGLINQPKKLSEFEYETAIGVSHDQTYAISQKINDVNKLQNIKELTNHYDNQLVESSTQLLYDQVYSTRILTTPLLSLHKNNLALNNSIISFLNKHVVFVNKKIPPIRTLKDHRVIKGATVAHNILETNSLELIRDKAVHQLNALHHKQFDLKTKHYTTKKPMEFPQQHLKTNLKKSFNHKVNKSSFIIQSKVESSTKTFNDSTNLKKSFIHTDNKSSLIKQTKVESNTKKFNNSQPHKKAKLLIEEKPRNITKLYSTRTTRNKNLDFRNKSSENTTEKDNQTFITNIDLLIPRELLNSNEKNKTTTKKPVILWEDVNIKKLPEYNTILTNHKPSYFEIEQINNRKQEDRDEEYITLDDIDFGEANME